MISRTAPAPERYKFNPPVLYRVGWRPGCQNEEQSIRDRNSGSCKVKNSLDRGGRMFDTFLHVSFFGQKKHLKNVLFLSVQNGAFGIFECATLTVGPRREHSFSIFIDDF